MASPKSWIDELYVDELARMRGLEPPPRPWRDLPALGQLTITRPALLKPFREHNRRHPDQAVRPYSFVSVAYPKPFARAEELRLVAPFIRPEDAIGAEFYELRTGEVFRVTTENLGGAIIGGLIPVKSYRDVVQAYLRRPEAKFLGPSGEPCAGWTTGALLRRSICLPVLEYLGKEGGLLERRVEGGASEDVQRVYRTQSLRGTRTASFSARWQRQR